MRTEEQLQSLAYEIYDKIKHGKLVSVYAIMKSERLDAFKAGAEWATAHPSIPPEIEEEIKFMASSLKEIPK